MLAASLLLILLPGLVLVRAPWPTVPALSIAFWILSWFLLPGFGSGRQAFVRTALAIFGLLALLRVLQPRLWKRPAPAALCLAGAGLVALAPLLLTEAPSVPPLSFDAALARLLVWRDGIPRSLAPLFLGEPFRTAAPGFQMLAADFAGLTADAVHRTTFLTYRLGVALFGLAVAYASSRSLRCGPWAATLAGATATFVLDLASRGLPAIGAAPLAVGLAVFGLSLLARLSTRSAAIASGLLGVASAATLPALTPLLAMAMGVALVLDWRRAGTVWNRSTLAAATALAVTLSLIWHLQIPAWSDLVDAGVYLGAPLTAAASGALVARLAETHRLAMACIAAALALGSALAWRAETPAFDVNVVRASQWLEAHVDPLDLVCNAPGDSGTWLPALAGRRVAFPAPAAGGYGPALPDAGACTFLYDDGSSGAIPAKTREVFRAGRIVLRAPRDPP